MTDLTEYTQTYREARPPLPPLARLRGFVRNGMLSARSLVSRPSGEPSLRLLYCHYVFDDQREQFKSVIRYVKSIGEFIDTDTVIGILDGQRPLTSNLFHLSFDDGKKSVFRNALPILKALDVPAILFVPTAIISSPRSMFEEHWRLSETASALVEVASWEDVKAARAAGFDIGSHTRTHARFSEISGSRAAIENEIFGSKQDIENQLGEECPYISWPYGQASDADDESLRCVQEAGYRACFGAFRGQVVPGSTSKFRIPRHNFEPEWPLSHVKCFVHGAMESA